MDRTQHEDRVSSCANPHNSRLAPQKLCQSRLAFGEEKRGSADCGRIVHGKYLSYIMTNVDSGGRSSKVGLRLREPVDGESAPSRKCVTCGSHFLPISEEGSS